MKDFTEISNIINSYLRKYEPEEIGIFGSYARNESKENSDIDILVSFKKTVTLIDLAHIRNELSEVLNIKVDLVTKRSLHPKILPFIEKDLRIIYQ